MLTALKTSLFGGGSARRRSSADTGAAYPGTGSARDLEGDEDDPRGEFAYGGRRPPAHASYPPPAGSSPASGNDLGAGNSAAAATIGASVPRVKNSMTRIKAMMRKMNPELLDTLSYPTNARQVAELQALLRDYVIPKDVLDAYAIHDGQDSFSVPMAGENAENEGNTGFIYGLWWMSIEEVIEEYSVWRRLDISNPPSPVATKKIRSSIEPDIKGKGRQRTHTHTARAPSTDAFLFGSEMDPRTVRSTMRSCPDGYVREEYSHPAWLPLLKDGYGNYIGIDLDPPVLSEDDHARIANSQAPPIYPARGQVIAFGREIDTKTVLWNGWADSNAYDNLGGGGWARFLAAFADDLSASANLHRSAARNARRTSMPYRSGGSDGYAGNHNDDDEEDEDAYRTASGGRQEAGSSHRAGAGLDWLSAGSAYSGLGTIEALVERSRRIWSSLGLPTAMSAYSPSQGSLQPLPPMDNAMNSQTANSNNGERMRKPPPLDFGTSPQQQQSVGGQSPKSARQGAISPFGRSISHPNADTSASSDDTSTVTLHPVIAQSALMQESLDTGVPQTASALSDTVLSDQANSATALVHPETAFKPPMSPEPSLILSPPSPKENAETFGQFPTSSSPPPQAGPSTVTAAQSTSAAGPSTPLTGTSPAFATTGLQSPARMSPGQAQRYSARQRDRTISGGSISHDAARQIAKRAPPPPVMPLGLPTLEFGNGIWEDGDIDGGAAAPYGYEKSSFEVVVDGQR